jgi:hypothetical protein
MPIASKLKKVKFEFLLLAAGDEFILTSDRVASYGILFGRILDY